MVTVAEGLFRTGSAFSVQAIVCNVYVSLLLQILYHGSVAICANDI